MGALLDTLNKPTTPSPTSSQPPGGKLLAVLDKQNVTPAANPADPTLDKPNPTSNPFMAGVRMFNNALDNAYGGIANAAYTANAAIARLGGNDEEADKSQNTANKVSSWLQKEDMKAAEVSKINPTAAFIGSALGTIVAATPLAAVKGSAITQGAITGAAYGGLSQPKGDQTRLGNAVKGAAIGAGVGAGLGATGAAASVIGNTIKNLWTGSKYLFKSADDIVDDAINNSFKAKNATSVTYATVENEFKRQLTGAKADYQKLITARDKLADALDIKVTKNNTQFYRDALINRLDQAGTEIDTTVLNAAKLALGKADSPATVANFQDAISKVGKQAFAAKKDNPGLTQELIKLKNAMELDMDSALAGNQQLYVLHNSQKLFFKETIAPLSDLQGSNALTDDFVNTKWVSDVFNRSKTDPAVASAFNQAPDKLQKLITASHVNALKTMKDTGADFDAVGYAKLLRQQYDQIPILKNLGIDIENIAKVSEAAGTAHKAAAGRLGAGFIAAGVAADMAGAGGAATTSALVFNAATKAPFLIKAGKILNNPSTRQLLVQARNLDNVAPPVKNAILTKLTSAYLAAPTADVPIKPAEAKTVSLGVRG